MKKVMRRALLLAVTIAVAVPIGGCATIIPAWKARPTASHDVDRTRLWTATGERRFVTWYTFKDGDQLRYLLCPEPVPFTAQAISSSAKPLLKPGEAISIGTEETFGTSLTAQGTLTENLAALDRNFANACNLFIAGVLDPVQFRQLVEADNAVRRATVLASAIKGESKEAKASLEQLLAEAMKTAGATLTLSLPSTAPPPAK